MNESRSIITSYEHASIRFVTAASKCPLLHYTLLWRFLSCEGGGAGRIPVCKKVVVVIGMQCGVIASADRGGSSRIMAEVVMDNMRRHQRQQQHVWSCSFAAMMMMRMTIVIMLLQLELIQVAEGLQVGYYAGTCPNVENIVKGVLSQQMQQNRGIAASVLRLHFHDCFVDVSNHHRYPMPFAMLNHSVILWSYVVIVCDLISYVNFSFLLCILCHHAQLISKQ